MMVEIRNWLLRDFVLVCIGSINKIFSPCPERCPLPYFVVFTTVIHNTYSIGSHDSRHSQPWAPTSRNVLCYRLVSPRRDQYIYMCPSISGNSTMLCSCVPLVTS